MESEYVDESTHSSVSSLKSRFEQLAARDVKNGPEERTPKYVKPISSERPRSVEEQRPQLSIDGARPIRSSSPQLPPRPKPKPRIDPPERTPLLGAPRSPQLTTVPKQDIRRTISLSVRNPIITVESPHSSSTPIEVERPAGPPSRPLLPPRIPTPISNSNAKPPLSPRPTRPKQEDRPNTPDIPRTPPPPPPRSPRVASSSPFTTPPELRQKHSPPTAKLTTTRSPAVPDKLMKPVTNGSGLQPPTQMAPDLPQRPTASPEPTAKPVLPPRPIENDTKRIFERPPPSRIYTAQTPSPRTKSDIEKHTKMTTVAISTFPPPPKRSSTLPSSPVNKEKDVTACPRTSSNANPPTLQANPDASSSNEMDLDASSSETEILEKQSPASISAYPDASRANRRAPLIPDRQPSVSTNMSIKHVCASGPYVAVSSSDLTKVFSFKKDSGSACIWSYVHPHSNDSYKVTSMEFKPSRDANADGRWLWIGTDKGGLMEFDLLSNSHGPVERRSTVHTSPVNAILRCQLSLWTIDESGKCQVWTAPEDTLGEISLASSPRTFRVNPRWTVAIMAGSRLWLSYGRQVQVFSPLLLNGDAFNVTQRNISLPPGQSVGVITCGATLPKDKDRVFLGHDDGKVSVYSQKTLTCLDVVPISIYNIATLTGVGDVLWAGFRTGMIYVYDTSVSPWRVCKDWDAHHKMKITHLLADQTSLWRASVGLVLSFGEDGTIKLWDALLMIDWLENEMQKREVEYCSSRNLNVVLCTWNAGASKPSDLNRGNPPEHNFLENVFNSIDSPDIIVFAFQELVDLEDKKLTAKSLLKGKNKSKTSSKTQEHMSHQYRVWQEKLMSALKIAASSEDDHYVLLHSATLVGLFTCIFIRHSEKSNIRNLSSTEVKTGLGGLHGNKGALIVRFTIDDSSLCFVNCHLAAGHSHTTHRNNDIANILESADLPPELDEARQRDYFVGGGDGSMVLDHEICVFTGDMNYRIDLPRDAVISAIQQNDFEKLLEHDQLLTQRRKNPGFRLRPFSEAPIDFAPTYKYNVGSDEYDTSEKKRTPAWCDRIYYRGANKKIIPKKYQRHEVYASDHRPVSAAFVASVKSVGLARKKKVWDETAKLWSSVVQKAIDDSKVDYISGTYGVEETAVRDTLHKKGGKAMDAIKALTG